MRLLQEADARRRRLVDLADEAVDIDARAPAAGGRARALTTDTLQLALLCGRTARPSGPAWQFPPPTVRMRAGHGTNVGDLSTHQLLDRELEGVLLLQHAVEENDNRILFDQWRRLPVDA